MTFTKFMLTLTLLHVFVGIASAQSKSSTASAPTFTVTLKLAKTRATTGTPLPIEITIENTTDHVVSIEEMLNFEKKKSTLYSVIRVWNADGRELRPADFQREVWAGLHHVAALAPGKSVHQKHDLSKLFDLSRPGKYTVNVGQDDFERSSGVESNVVAFEITP